MVERVAAGERQAERFPVAGRVTAGERLAGRHLAAIFSFAPAVPCSCELFGGPAGQGLRCH